MLPLHLRPDLVVLSILVATLLIGASVLMLVIGAQLERRRTATAQDLAEVAAVMREISRGEDARGRLGRAVCELTGAAIGGLMEPDGRGNLVMTAAHGLETRITVSLDDGSAAAGVFHTGCNRFMAVDPVAERRGVMSTLHEPVILDDKVVGVLFLAWQPRKRRS
jgi:hypothetical protein